MANIIDYLKWRGDLSFEQSPINEIDNIILARFSYIPFKYIYLDNIETIESIARKMEQVSIEKYIWNEDANFIQELAQSKRYKYLEISDYSEIIEISAEKQFAAITITLPQKCKYVSFRGTDTTLVGWKEDFNMGFMKDVPSQKEALKYLNNIAKKYKDNLIIGGHSKGGNLAVYSATFCNDKIKKRIINIINADGPGFDKNVIIKKEYKQVLDKINTYIPQSSIVGRLLEHEEDYQVIKSTQKGIMQHDIYSWQLEGTKLEHIKSVTNNSQIFNSIVREWLKNTTSEQRENFINIIYEIIITTEVKDLKDFGINTAKKIAKVVNTYKNIKEENKKEIEKMIKLLFKSAFKVLKENKKYEISAS